VFTNATSQRCVLLYVLTTTKEHADTSINKIADLPRLVAFVGVTNPNTQLLLNIIYAIGGWVPAIIGARLHDVVGRRKMLMGATAGMAVCLAIAAGTAANFVQSGSQQASVASITFIYIFGSVFALGFTSMQPIYPGEVLSNDMRAKGMGVFQLTSGCAGFVNTFAAPVALNKVRTTRVLVLSTQCDLLLTSEPDRLLVLRLLRVLGSFRIRFYLFLLCRDEVQNLGGPGCHLRSSQPAESEHEDPGSDDHRHCFRVRARDVGL